MLQWLYAYFPLWCCLHFLPSVATVLFIQDILHYYRNWKMMTFELIVFLMYMIHPLSVDQVKLLTLLLWLGIIGHFLVCFHLIKCFEYIVLAVGFNSILEIPVYIFETGLHSDMPEPKLQRYVTVPNEIFGVPVRPDILHRCYHFYRRAKAGYCEDMQLYKWEWPGTTKKWRKQQKSGKARIGWKKSPGKYLGVFAHPIRPHDLRTKIMKRCWFDHYFICKMFLQYYGLVWRLCYLLNLLNHKLQL